LLDCDSPRSHVQLSLSSLGDDENLYHTDKGRVLNAPFHCLSFTHLYATIASCIHEEFALLLFYSLLHRNPAFREFVLAKSDVDGLLVPLLESLYAQKELRCNRVYMVLIVLLILSQVRVCGEDGGQQLMMGFSGDPFQ
jgi:hypothetical protein